MTNTHKLSIDVYKKHLLNLGVLPKEINSIIVKLKNKKIWNKVNKMSDKNKVIDEIEKKNEVFDKDITQEDKVEPVAKALSDMGQYYKKITKKLVNDGICYNCKKKLDKKKKFIVIEVPNNKVDKGLIAFVAICLDCNKDK